MKKLILAAFGALALFAGGASAEAAPAIDAPVQTALYQADGVTATVQPVQYRRYGYRAAPRGFYRPHRRFYRPPVRGYYGRRGIYRGPGYGYRRY